MHPLLLSAASLCAATVFGSLIGFFIKELPHKWNDTVLGYCAGIMLGAACMLDGMIDRMEQELGQPATVLATGGIARFVIPMGRRTIIFDRNLLLKGLTILYENNKKG